MWAEACATIERAEQLQRRFFQPDLASTQAPSWEPPVDIFESATELLILAALPGVEIADLDVSLDRNLLVIGGTRRLPRIDGGAGIRRLEIPHGRFERRIRLPHSGFAVESSTLASGCLALRLTVL